MRLLALAAVAAATSCTWTAPTGDTFDLSGLTKDDYWMVQDAQLNFRYYLNVCKNAAPPKECTDGKEPPSPTYQVEAKSWKHLCKALSTLHVQTWNLLDPKDPQKGVEMTYGGGMKCGKTPREIRFHFICSPHFDEGPLQIFETKESCHYNVTWASKYGCPTGRSWSLFGGGSKSSSSSTSSSSWTLSSYFRLFMVGMFVYVTAGCAFLKYTQPDVPIGLGTCPNVEFWIALLDGGMKMGLMAYEKAMTVATGTTAPEKDFDDKFPMGKDDPSAFDDDEDEDDAP